MVEKDAAARIVEVAERYIAAWNEPDADARLRISSSQIVTHLS